MRIYSIEKESIVDGPGLRTVIFFQGCGHGCPGCHNPETHRFEGGQQYSPQRILEIIDSDKLSTGVTFSGGDPVYQILGEDTKAELFKLTLGIKQRKLNLGLYTGFGIEELEKLCATHSSAVISLCNWIVAEPFINSQKSTECAFRGSLNQRVYTNALNAPDFGFAAQLSHGPSKHFIDITDQWDAGKF